MALPTTNINQLYRWTRGQNNSIYIQSKPLYSWCYTFNITFFLFLVQESLKLLVNFDNGLIAPKRAYWLQSTHGVLRHKHCSSQTPKSPEQWVGKGWWWWGTVGGEGVARDSSACAALSAFITQTACTGLLGATTLMFVGGSAILPPPQIITIITFLEDEHVILPWKGGPILAAAPLLHI